MSGRHEEPCTHVGTRRQIRLGNLPSVSRCSNRLSGRTVHVVSASCESIPTLFPSTMADTVVSSVKTKINIIPQCNRGIPWFDDGNVILMSHELAFKVYKGMLSQHSTILKEMIETGAAEVIEGCPAILLDDDSTTDLSNFLTVIHGCERR